MFIYVAYECQSLKGGARSSLLHSLLVSRSKLGDRVAQEAEQRVDKKLERASRRAELEEQR